MPKTTTPYRIGITLTTENVSENDQTVPRFGVKVAKTPSVGNSAIQKKGFCEKEI